MAFKFVAFATLIAAASAGLLPVAHHGAIATSHSSIQHHAAPAVHYHGDLHASPAVYHHAPAIIKTIAQPTIVKSVEHHAPANYEFSYSVHDEHTGDIKSQHETRHGDEVHGQYSLLDSDGHHRIVDYHADHHSGFNAVVRREPANVKVLQPVHKVIAQPVHVHAHHAAPIAHHVAPVAHATYQHHHAAPIAHHAIPVAHATIQHHHAAPIAHYAAPIAHHAAPIAHSSSSIVHGHNHLSHHHY